MQDHLQTSYADFSQHKSAFMRHSVTHMLPRPTAKSKVRRHSSDQKIHIPISNKTNKMPQIEREKPMHQYKWTKNSHHYLKERFFRTSSHERAKMTSEDQMITLRLSTELALGMTSEQERRERLYELYKLQGGKIKLRMLKKEKEPEPVKKELKRTVSCDIRLPIRSIPNVSATSRMMSRELVYDKTKNNQSVSSQKHLEAKSTMCESDVDSGSRVFKDSISEEDILSKIHEFVKKYNNNLETMDQSKTLDSSRDISSFEKEEYPSRAMITECEKKSPEIHKQESISRIKGNLSERNDKIVKNLKTQQDYANKRIIETPAGGNKLKKRMPSMKKSGTVNVLLFNEISDLAMDKEMDSKPKVKVMKRGRWGSISSRQSVNNDENEKKQIKLQRSLMMKMERVFGK